MSADPKVYITLWFDTEDYITPADDEACLRLAKDLTARGVQATFKIVGEKARVLEQRKRRDAIAALKRHDIAYHSDNHSIPPTPAVYLRKLGMVEGAEEFLRREGPGARDTMRIFGVKSLSTYGQPGSSWGPQSHAALRKLGIPSYVDEGRHVGLDNQPFWYGGLFWVFNLGPNSIRVDIEDESKLAATVARAEERVRALQAKGGGVLHFWYHPNEFVTTEFWDGVNFSRGASPPREAWKPAKLRTPESSERAYRIFNSYIDRLKAIPGTEFASVAQLMPKYASAAPPPIDAERAKAFLRESIDHRGDWSAAELLAAALGLPGETMAPTAKRESTYHGTALSPAQLETAAAQARRVIRETRALPVEVWIDSETLSIGDFAATFAHGDGRVHRGALAFEKYIATDACRNFNWVIHPEGFCAPELYELARVEAWTIKPAKLKK
ncbi:MAG: hypothetical protein SFV18_12065 [Bryobacteraceae bacterium]|nr:hypothetical protein [Bryobacteraceae bacterium]